MSGTTYICGEFADRIVDAVRDGRDIHDIADQLEVDPDYLGRLLQLPVNCDQPVHASEDVDLWAMDRLDAVL